MARKRLGQLLVDTGLIRQDDLHRALEEQKQWGGPLGQIMVELGLVKEMDLVYVLSRQLNIPVANLEGRDIPGEVLDLVPGEFCQKHNLLPFHHEPVGNFLDVAMVEPLNVDTLDRLRVMTKSNVRPHFTTYSTLARMLRKHYDIEINWQDSAREGIRYRPPGDLHLDARERDISELIEGEQEPAEDETQPPPEQPSSQPTEPRFATTATTEDSFREIHADMKALAYSLQEGVAELRSRIDEVEALLERDERVLRRILGLLLDKEICTQRELEELLSD
jgi:hypothetical protein